MITERQIALDSISAQDLKIPERGIVFFPERYRIIDLFETKVRKGLFLPRDTLINTALIIPKIPGKADLTTGFQMMLTKINPGGKLDTLASSTISLETRGYQGICLRSLCDTFTLFNSENIVRKHLIKSGYSKKIESLEKVVGKHIGIIHKGVELKRTEDIENVAKDIAPELVKFFDMYPDFPTSFYFKNKAKASLRLLKIRLEDLRN